MSCFYVFRCNLGQNKGNVFCICNVKYHMSLCFYVFENAPICSILIFLCGALEQGLRVHVFDGVKGTGGYVMDS